METGELKSKAIKGSVWALLEKFSIQLMQFVVAVVLARLLNPKDFGLIVLATIFSGVAAAISDGGFEKAIIQSRHISPIQIDTVFYINVFLGALLTLLLFLLAPFISDYFHEPNLKSVLKVVSFGTFINALSQVQRILLMKELNFKRISIAQIASAFVGGCVGICLAYMGYGVWALVFSTLIAQLIVLIVFWVKSSWYPSLRFSYLSVKEILPYGLNVLFSSILFFFVQQFSNLIIGKYYAGRDLGLVNRGSKIPEITASVTQSIILKIAFPLLARIRHDPTIFKNGLKHLVQTIAFFSFPALLLLMANASDITILLFTKKWIGSIVFFQIFCLIKMLDTLVSLFREVVLVQGDGKFISKILIITSVIEILLISLSVSFGLYYVIYALLLSMIFQYLIYIFILSKKINISIAEQLSWIVPYILLASSASLSSFLFDYFLKDAHLAIFIKLLFKLSIGTTIYIIGLFIFQVNEASYFKIRNNSLINLKYKV